ncbi:Rrf2 family transcriptional regulator [Albibacterium sp.]|uniref:RrF2 family transcriptional regulator n=1 Tax=Albibacterium sp. TaxID=2952885 RepID=UPI002C5F5D0D|nr:Rrf2 family transcriptional regulator [Albibacterium sp.]HUH19927.1 Rrf2 family transcriptional regulator [Albibacterium sp.]
MFSKTCEYGIRAMIFISQKSSEGVKVGVKEVSSGIDSPVHFIAKILQDLGRKNLVQSFKGPNGGFFIEKDSEVTLADIVIAIDGDKLFKNCGLGLGYCSEERPCPIHHDFKKIRNDITIMLHTSKLSEFSQLLKDNLTYLKLF